MTNSGICEKFNSMKLKAGLKQEGEHNPVITQRFGADPYALVYEGRVYLYMTGDTFICNEYSSGAKESGWLVFALVENSTELFPQVGFKYDGYEDEKNPWFISYNFLKNEWKPVSEKDFNERKSTFDKYERFNYKPLSSLKY